MSIEVGARIYLEDTDAGQIVYHAAYLRFMERARTELLRAVGCEQSQTFEQDLSFVVHSMSLEFQLPARLDAEIVATCRLLEAKGARLVFEQAVRDKHSAHSHCTARVTVACVSLQRQRPRRVPADLLERMRVLA
jgi:4-hydroxybenzoyl-CoA thioesterase